MEVLGCLVKPAQGFPRSVYNLGALLSTPISRYCPPTFLGSLWDHTVLTNQSKPPVCSPAVTETSSATAHAHCLPASLSSTSQLLVGMIYCEILTRKPNEHSLVIPTATNTR